MTRSIPPSLRLKLAGLRLATGLITYGAHGLWAFFPLIAWVALGLIAVHLILVTHGALSAANALPLAHLFWLGVAVCLWRGVAVWRLNPPPALDRAIEHANHTPHRPLALLHDQPFAGHADIATWQQAQVRAQIQIRRLQHPGQPRLPRFASLRLLLCTLVVLGAAGTLLFTNPRPWPDFAHHLRPWPPTLFAASQSAPVLPDVTLTLTPPGYTGWPQLVLSAPPAQTNASPVSLLPDTRIEITQTPRFWPLILWRNGWPEYHREATLRLDHLNPGTLRLTRVFSPRIRLVLTPVRDTPPTAAWAGDPQAHNDGSLRIRLRLRDDFGIEAMNIHLSPAAANGADDEYRREPLSLPGSAKEDEVDIPLSLADSYLAGQPVILRLEVIDHLGQVATLPPRALTLPERQFRQPAARLLAGVRRGLINAGPKAAPPASQTLEQALSRPNLFGRDIVAVLGTRVAAARLRYLKDDTELRGVNALLWRLAERLEEGGPSLRDATARLTAAQKKLQQLLNDPQTNAEQLDAAMEEIQRALAETLQTLAQRLSQQGDNQRFKDLFDQFPDLADQTAQMQDLGDFLEQLRAEIAAGHRDKARAMLEQLQRLAGQMANASANLPQQIEELMDMIDRLQNLVAQQRDLKDRTAKQASDDQPLSPLATEQNKLADALQGITKELSARLPITPPQLTTAHEHMQAATNALKAEQSDTALNAQQAALDALQQGQQQLGQTLMQQMRRMVLMPIPQGQEGRQQQEGGDESGQNQQAQQFDATGTTPREAIRAILRKLRDRAGPHTPKEEREYFERLLRQF